MRRVAVTGMPTATLSPWQRRAWFGALGCFLLAALTGVLFRLGQVSGGLPAGLAFDNVRHAHSHLMYFGWATLGLFTAMEALLPLVTGRRLRRPRLAQGILLSTLVAGLLSYPFFLLFGYAPVQLGSARLPLAAVVASLSVLAWYAFAVAWAVEMTEARRPAQDRVYQWSLRPSLSPGLRDLVRRLWGSALAFLVLSSLGVWGRAALNALGIQDPFWQEATVHLFLDVFSDGWLVLAVLGAGYLLHTSPQAAPSPGAPWGWRLAVAGIPLSFLVGVPVALVPVPARVVAGLASGLSGLGLLLLVADLACQRPVSRLWRGTLVALAVKGIASLLLVWPQLGAWLERANLRILYLHILLLGGVTLGLLSVMEKLGGLASEQAGMRLMGAVTGVLLSLVPLTNLWPARLRGPWSLAVAAVAAGLAWLAGMGVLHSAIAAGRAGTAGAMGRPGLAARAGARRIARAPRRR